MRKVFVNTDGACAGNPGQMGIGVHITDAATGEEIDSHSSSVGYGTNNVAEYMAVIVGLEMLTVIPNIKIATIRADSQLVIRQLQGKYAVKTENLMKLHKQAMNVLECISFPVMFEWVPRAQNPIADALASKAVKMPQTDFRNGKVILWDTVRMMPFVEKLAELPIPKCEADVLRLNSNPDEAKFAELMRLKPGGTDSYSKFTAENLVEAILIRFGKDATDWITSALTDSSEEYRLNALRWAARGLRPDFALKKASVDVEVEANRKSKKT